MAANAVPIPKPLNGFVSKAVLFDFENPALEFQWEPATAIGVMSYDGNAPTLKILVLSSGAVFDYVPMTHFVVGHSTCKTGDFELSDLCPFNCEGSDVSGVVFPALEGDFTAFLTPDKVPEKATYVMSLDWPSGNQAGTLAVLDGSHHLAVVPNHKALFLGKKELPKYKKLHKEWKV